jgi:hypothetical protein
MAPSGTSDIGITVRPVIAPDQLPILLPGLTLIAAKNDVTRSRDYSFAKSGMTGGAGLEHEVKRMLGCHL